MFCPIQTFTAVSEWLDIPRNLFGSNLLHNVAFHTHTVYIYLARNVLSGQFKTCCIYVCRYVCMEEGWTSSDPLHRDHRWSIRHAVTLSYNTVLVFHVISLLFFYSVSTRKLDKACQILNKVINTLLPVGTDVSTTYFYCASLYRDS
jgi:hypothetical protein